MALNAGPLTTIFTPPTTCLDVITSGLSPYSPSYSLFIGHFGPYYSPALTCSPTATALIDYYTNDYYWSPGYCPSGYTTACSYTPVNLGSEVTASLCCPIGFDCVYVWPHVCSSTATTTLSNVWVLEGITETPPSSYNFITIQPTPTLIVWNDGVPVAWESTDTAILHLITSGANTAATPTTSPSPNLPSQTSSGSTAAPTDTSLPKSTIIIIATSSSAITLLILLLIYYHYGKFLKARTAQATDPDPQFMTPPNPPWWSTPPERSEADSTTRYEISSPFSPISPIQEIHSTERYELGSEWKQGQPAIVHELDGKDRTDWIGNPLPSETRGVRVETRVAKKPVGSLLGHYTGSGSSWKNTQG